MFKKDIQLGSKTKVKSSVQRGIRSKVLEAYPLLEPHIDEILPKKEQLDLIKLPDRVTLFALGTTPLFFQHMDNAILPHLGVVHRYPTCFPRLRIDRGAIRFVLSGATLMAPGLTSPGGRLPDPEQANSSTDEPYPYGTADLPAGTPVVIEAEGKETACFVGVLKIGTEQMKKEKKGAACDAGHYLGDGLWKLVLD